MTCPICQRASDPKYRPFCSRRCADADLGNWLSGTYAIPAAPEEEKLRDDDAPVQRPQ